MGGDDNDVDGLVGGDGSDDLVSGDDSLVECVSQNVETFLMMVPSMLVWYSTCMVKSVCMHVCVFVSVCMDVRVFVYVAFLFMCFLCVYMAVFLCVYGCLRRI